MYQTLCCLFVHAPEMAVNGYPNKRSMHRLVQSETDMMSQEMVLHSSH